MNLHELIERYKGVTVTIVTTNPAAPVARGEVVDGDTPMNSLVLKLTANYDSFTAGSIVYFNVLQIVSIG